MSRSTEYDSTDSDEEFDTDEESNTDDDDTPWISRFCKKGGRNFFCNVEQQFIEDGFNLHGLEPQVPSFKYCLGMILNWDPPYDYDLSAEENKRLNFFSEKLYGLIHARYIISAAGLAKMREKYKQKDFGVCPRVGCKNQACLPVGESDRYGECLVKIFCPKCEDIYYPKFKLEGSVDGACFGTSFPQLFLMTYPDLKPERPSQSYVPRVFGFKICKNTQPTATRIP